MTEGCPFYQKKIHLSCYVFTPGRYRSLPDFISNKSTGNASFSIAGSGNLDCMSILDAPIQAKPQASKCVNCMYCVFGCPGNKFTVSETYEISSHCNDSPAVSDWGPLNDRVKNSFSGSLLDENEFQSVSFFNPLGRYQGFEDFTAVDETMNIAVWLGNTIKFLLGKNSRVSLEIPIDIPGADRDGRLDVSGIIENYLITCETKTTFKDLMADKRFVEQMSGYEKKLKDETNGTSIRFQQFLVIGGAETDLLPPGDPHSTSRFGNDSEIFYGLLKDHNIRFISAKAFLLLGLKALVSPVGFNLENELIELFPNNSLGLVTSGPVIQD